MLMLQRAAENVNPSECNDPAVLLACSLGSDSCPAACQKKADEESSDTEKKDTNRVIAGDLDVSVVDYSSEIKSAPMGIFVVNTLKFNASEKIQLDSLTLKRTGLGSSKAISKVWLEKNGVAVTNSASVGSDGLAVLNFKSNRDTISEATEYELVVQTADNSDGNEFAFELKSVESTAKNTTVKGTTNTYRISKYEVVVLEARAQNVGNAPAYEVGSNQDYIIWEFSLTSESSKDDRNIYVKSLTFKNKGTLDIADTFKNIKVYRDSKVVSNNVEINGKDMTVSLDEDIVAANKKAIYTIRAEIATLEEVGKNVQLQLQNTRDIVADEEDTNFRANIHFGDPDKNGDYLEDKVGITLASYTFNGGKVTFESDSKFAQTVDAGIGATEVRIAKWRINISEPVDLPTMVFTYGTDYTATTALTNGWEAVKRLVLVIGDKRYTADPDANGTITFSDISIKNSANVELLLNLSSKVKENESITFNNISSALMNTHTQNNDWDDIYYQGTYTNNDEYFAGSDVAWLIQIADVNIKTPKFTISSESIDTQETVKNNSSLKTIMKWTLSAKDNDINVNNFKVILQWTRDLAAGENVQLYFKLNGKDFGSRTFNALEAYSFNSLGTLKVGETWNYEISVAPVIANPGEFYVDVEASGTDTNGNATKTSTETSATLKVNGDATISVATTSSSDRVSNPTNNVVVYEGDLTVENGTITLKKFDLDVVKWDALIINSYKITVDDDNLGNAADNSTDTEIKFAWLSKSLTEGVHKVQVKANVSANASAADTTTYIAKTCAAWDTEVTDEEDVNYGECEHVDVETTYIAKTCAAWDTEVTDEEDANYGKCAHITKGDAYSPADFLFKVSKASVNWWDAENANVKAYFAKGFFMLSKTSSDKSNLVVKLTNNSSKSIKITWVDLEKVAVSSKLTMTVDGTKVWKTVDNDGNLTAIADGINVLADNWSVTVAAWKSIDIRIIASGKDDTGNAYAALKWVVYSVTDGWTTYSYELDDNVSSVAGGSWADYYASYRD